MPDWLVIAADRTRAGRGVRGHALAWFLRAYFGRRRVALITPKAWRSAGCPTAANVFLGLPSSLTSEEIDQVVRDARCRRLVPFDYLDQHALAWTDQQQRAVRALADCYLKPWREEAWKYEIRMGLLPLRSDRRLVAAAQLARVKDRFVRRPAPRYDVTFLGRPNRTRVYREGRVSKIQQRLEWVREIKCDAQDLSFCGGLVHCDSPQYRAQEKKYGDLSELQYKDRTASFAAYWRCLRHSRVLLAPGGNVPWTYRHYECLYAGAIVATIDFRRREMLVPLPREGMVHVPDGAPVTPAVREALELSRRRPEIAAENVAHLERYLRRGAYARDRKALLERFLSQLG